MIELYHSHRSRSMRTLWLLEELHLKYKLHETDFMELIQKKHHSESYLKLHPQGLVPLIVDDDLTLYESGAIALYLTGKYDKVDKLSPDKQDKNAHAKYIQWVFWACCTLEPPVWSLVKHTLLLPKEKRNLTTIKSSTKKYHEVLTVLEKELADKTYILGAQFSSADIIIASLLEWYPKILKNYSNLSRYRIAYTQRDAYKKAYRIK